jgi:predicted transcriptional regulator
MAVIQRQKKAEMVPLRIKLEKEQHGRLERYAKHLDSSVDYIIAEALDFVIRKDKDFAGAEGVSTAEQPRPPRGKRPQTREAEI